MPPTTILEQIRRDEGERVSAYPDSRGYWTIGNGVCIDARKGCGLTRDEIALLTSNRLALALADLEREWPWTNGLDSVRLGALQNMVYQMGTHGVSAFHDLLACLERGDWLGAKTAALASAWANETPARAARIAEQFLTGVWQ